MITHQYTIGHHQITVSKLPDAKSNPFEVRAHNTRHRDNKEDTVQRFHKLERAVKAFAFHAKRRSVRLMDRENARRKLLGLVPLRSSWY